MSIPPRPTGYAAWASGVSGHIVEPSQSQKNTGWQAGQAPPASYQNWLDGLGYRWQAWTDAALFGGGFVAKDDFTGNLVGGGPFQWNGSGMSCVSDASGGGWGALLMLTNASITSAGVQTAEIPVMTGFWQYEARFRSQGPTHLGNFSVGVSDALGPSGAVANMVSVSSGMNFALITNPTLSGISGLVRVDLGVRPGPGYHRVLLDRRNNTLTCAIYAPTGLAVTASAAAPHSQLRGRALATLTNVNGPNEVLLDYLGIAGDRR
jgi:hypothetical protein